MVPFLMTFTLNQISTPCHYLKLNVSEMVRDNIVTMEY